MATIVRYNAYSTDAISATYTIPGTLVAPTIGATRFYIGSAATIRAVHISVGTAPTGGSTGVVVDMNVNGTSIFTISKPTISLTTYASLNNVPTSPVVTASDYITIDVDSVGTTIPGSDLVVVIDYTVNAKKPA